MNLAERPRTRYPVSAFIFLAWVAILVIDCLAISGTLRLTFTPAIDRIFESPSERYIEYQQVASEFDANDGILVLVEGRDLASPRSIEAFESFLIDLQFLAGVSTVLSPFSVPLPDGKGGFTALSELEGAPEETWARSLLVQPELARILSQDLSRALVNVRGDVTGASIARIHELARSAFAETGLSAEVTGMPVVIDRSRELVVRDFLLLNAIGITLGLVVVMIAVKGAWLVLQMFITAISAVLWGMGALGWMGFEINVVSIALSVLILAVSASDAVHLGLEQHKLARESRPAPVFAALRHIGPAAVLTSVTTALALASLGLSDSGVIAGMGLSGALALMVATLGCLATSTLVGTTLVHVLGPQRAFPASAAATRRIVDWRWLPHASLSAPRMVAGFGILATLATVAAFFSAEARFSLSENLPDSDPAMVALNDIHAEFGSTAMLLMAIDPGGTDPVVAVRAVTDAVRNQLPEAAPISVASLADIAVISDMTLADLIAALPEELRPAFDGSATGRFLVSVPFDYQDANATRVLSLAIETELAQIPQQQPGVTPGRTTGFHVMSSFVSESMIVTLSYSLLLAVTMTGLIVTVWLKSLRFGAIALVANILPISVVGAGLALSGHGLTFTSGIALTLAFGIAVDDTLHVFNRIRLDGRAHGRDPAMLAPSMNRVTPALVTTSLVLAAGFSGTLAASLPTVVFFGTLVIIVLGLALLSDLFVLPALIWSTQKR